MIESLFVLRSSTGPLYISSKQTERKFCRRIHKFNEIIMQLPWIALSRLWSVDETQYRSVLCCESNELLIIGKLSTTITRFALTHSNIVCVLQLIFMEVYSMLLTSGTYNGMSAIPIAWNGAVKQWSARDTQTYICDIEHAKEDVENRMRTRKWKMKKK